MRIDKDDPRLIDYALGELDEKEGREIEAALEQEANEEARQAVAAFRALAGAAGDALQSEAAQGLREEQRAAVVRQAESGKRRPTRSSGTRRFAWGKGLAAAAVVLLLIGGIAIMTPNLQRSRMQSTMAKNEPSDAAPMAEEDTASIKAFIQDSRRLPENADARGITRYRFSVPELEEGDTPEDATDSEVLEFNIEFQTQSSVILKDPGIPSPEPALAEPAPTTTVDFWGEDLHDLAQAVVEPASSANTADLGSTVPYVPSAKPLPRPASSAAETLGFGGVPEMGQPSRATAGRDAPQYYFRGSVSDGVDSFDEFPIGLMSRVGGQAGQGVTSLGVEEAGVSPVTLDFYGHDLDGDGVDSSRGRKLEHIEALGYLGERAGDWRYLHARGESYAPITENAFLRVAQQPLSTFSIDVDTASYSNVRRFLSQGGLPPRDAVRLEELINYFDYAYPEPDEGRPFSVHAELGACPWQPEHLLAKIGLKGVEIERDERPAGNFVFLLDVSGSMKSANKLPLVRESMKALLEELEPQDRVAIVTYASNSSVALQSTSCEKKARIRKAIDRLNAGGSTHGSAGIRDAYRIASEHFIEGGINRVILATDGDFNVGVTSQGDLISLIEKKAKSKVFLTALGFGMGNIKDATLEQLADKGNGNYAYVDNFTEARRVLVDQLTGTLITIAKDVKIQVEFNPSKVSGYRLLGYENRVLAARDFNDDTKDAGEIGAGHTVTALYQIVPAGVSVEPGVDPLKYRTTPESEETDIEPSGEWMTVKLRYKHPEGDTSAKLEYPVESEPVTLRKTSDDFRCAAAAAGFGMLLRDSQYQGRATWDMVHNLAESAKANEAERQAFADLVITAKTLAGGR